MTKTQALADGFCQHCAALWGVRQLCGVLAIEKTLCQLDIETQQRWIIEHHLNKPSPIRGAGAKQEAI